MVAQRIGGLGKGLSALFEDMDIDVTDVRNANNKEGIDENGILFLDINRIAPNSKQPRKNFDEEKIDELARSIEVHGVLQPIMVRKSGEGYEIVAGERRWRAARKAGLKKVPSILRNLTEEEYMLVSIIENMQREDLNPMEEAEALSQMIITYGLTQEQISKSVGKSRPYITNVLRLLKLPLEIQEMVVSGLISTGHARAIIGIEDKKIQLELAKYAAKEQISVREMEKLSKSSTLKTKVKPVTKKKSIEIACVEEELKDILGTKVQIKYSGKKGSLEIQCYSKEELDRIIELLRSLK
jgi:ParB family chromosome partitioning protein